MSRAEHIKDLLDEHFTVACGLAVATPPPTLWRKIMEELGPQARFGWSWPIEHDGPAFLVPYCPEIIDEQTTNLDDVELKEYTDVIRWVCQSHVLFWDETPDPVDRQRRIEDELDEKYPGTLTVWNEVRLSILDRNAC